MLASRATTEQFRLEYDGSNYTSFTVASNGQMTISGTGSGAVHPVMAAFGSSSTANNSTLYVAQSASTSTASIALGGVLTSYSITERGSSALSPAVGSAMGTHIIGTRVVNIASSGTHPVFTNFAIKPLSVTATGGS